MSFVLLADILEKKTKLFASINGFYRIVFGLKKKKLRKFLEPGMEKGEIHKTMDYIMYCKSVFFYIYVYCTFVLLLLFFCLIYPNILLWI